MASKPPRFRVDGEAIFVAFLGAVGLVIFIRTFDVHITQTADPFGPRTLPWLLSGFVVSSSVAVLVVKALRRPGAERLEEGTIHREDDLPSTTDLSEGSSVALDRPSSPGDPNTTGLKDPATRRAAVGVGIVAYVVIMQITGFIASTALFTISMLWILGERSKRTFAVLTLFLSVGLYVLFEYVLRVRLP